MVGTQANSRRVGISDEVMRDLVNAGAVDLVAATVKHGASSESARPGGATSPAKANEAGTELDALAITPEQVAKVVAPRRRGASRQTSWRVR